MTVTDKQPVPTDAEIEAAIDRHGGACVDVSDYEGHPDFYPKHDVLENARANLLRLIAAQRSAARREALESVREWFADSGNAAYDETGRQTEYTRIDWVIAHIDAMLAKEDGDE